MTLDTAEVIRIDLPASYKYLNILSGCIAEVMTHAADVSDHETIVYNLQLAAHEVCTNIVGHAYVDAGHHERIQVELTLADTPRRLIIELRDGGRSFDPTLVPPPVLDQPQIHGYGLFIIQALMDEVAYTPQSNGNHWRLVKFL